MFGTKKKIEDFFISNWTETTIQFDEVQFTKPLDNKWISIKVIPFDRKLYAFDGNKGRKRTAYILQVRCFDITKTLTHNLATTVLNMIECIDIDTLRIGLAQGDGTGAQNLNNEGFSLLLNIDLVDYQ